MDEMGNTESSFFIPKEPTEQIEERNEERAKVMKGMAMLEDVIARFEKRITFYDMTKSIEVDVTTNPEEHLRAVLVAKGMSENLTQEKEWLENLRSTFTE